MVVSRPNLTRVSTNNYSKTLLKMAVNIIISWVLATECMLKLDSEISATKSASPTMIF